MIGKIRNIQDSWIMKLILILTALSFMSLFGISGYVNSSARNKPVIKVDDLVVTQEQISNMLNQELQTAKNLFGENLDLNDNIRNAILQGIVQKELSRTILHKTAADNNVHVSEDLIKKIIASQPDFMENGQFSANKMRRLLASSGWTEQRYIEALRDDIIKMHLVQNIVEDTNVPTFMAEYIFKIDNQKKVFKYINIDADKMKIDRKISQDEIEQYYNDFATQFIDPENRDVSFIALSANDVAKNAAVADSDIEQYYEEHKTEFVVPEKRKILQMVFDNEEAANAAANKLKKGADFYAVAQSDAKQDRASTELGDVEKDMLIGDMGDEMFALKKGEVSAPVKSEFGWHIMKIVDIYPMKKTSLAAAKAKIVDILRKEQTDDAVNELAKKIEDEVASGKTLKEVAETLKTPVYSVKALKENGAASQIPNGLERIVKSPDFVETAFSYNKGEVSQVMETEDGFAVLSIDNIVEARQMSMDEVIPQIEKLWEANEKSAIAQEVINDVIHDVENGDNIADVAKRFNLPIATTKPLKKNESFDGLSSMQMQELFRENIGSPKVIGDDDRQVIVVPTQIINSTVPMSRGDVENIRSRAEHELAQDMAQQLIVDYGSNYRIKVKYKALGFMD